MVCETPSWNPKGDSRPGSGTTAAAVSYTHLGQPESKSGPIDVDTESPEERKVRRAKARAAYTVAQSVPQPTVSVMEIEV